MQALAERIPGPALMGIVNVTPDSFSDGGRYENESDRKSTRLNSSHTDIYRMPSSA